jgi:hypothetical protein
MRLPNARANLVARASWRRVMFQNKVEKSRNRASSKPCANNYLHYLVTTPGIFLAGHNFGYLVMDPAEPLQPDLPNR